MDVSEIIIAYELLKAQGFVVLLSGGRDSNFPSHVRVTRAPNFEGVDVHEQSLAATAFAGVNDSNPNSNGNPSVGIRFGGFSYGSNSQRESHTAMQEGMDL